MEETEKSNSIPEIERFTFILFRTLQVLHECTVCFSSRILCRALLASDAAQPKQRVLLELYTNLVLFCKEQHFNREQTSVLISIIKTVHQFNTETPLNNTDHCMTYRSELLLCHSVRRPPFSIDLFSSEQVTQIFFYFINTYMRHYFLYKCIFTPEVQLDISLSYIGILENTNVEKTSQSGTTACSNMQYSLHTTNKITVRFFPQGSSLNSELRTIVQKEVRDEVMRLTSQLQQRLQDSADQLNDAISKLETNIKVKK
uniref:Si:ch73-81k8.2 n=1 Tax=Sinocyclocheilus anshuiensis TaxID=1608454 RepID=A0A671PTF4_9TELE